MADSIYRKITGPISKTGYRSSATLGSYRHVSYGTEAPKLNVEPVIPEPVVTPIMPVEPVEDVKVVNDLKDYVVEVEEKKGFFKKLFESVMRTFSPRKALAAPVTDPYRKEDQARKLKEEKDKKKFGYSIDVYENTSAAQAKNRLAAALQNDRANTRVIPTEIKVTTPKDKSEDDGFDIE